MAIMEARLDLAVAKGCDAVDPDNVDLHQHDTGFSISDGGMVAFNLALVDAAHARGLAIGLKNNIEQFDAIASAYDFAVNEECFEFDECAEYSDDFIDDDKAVFHIEYAVNLTQICAVTQSLGLSTLKKSLDLDAPFQACP